ncbi:MFS transporter [Leifsonia sp. NPDC058230]|uniref:MFS transporter n=1 Tax=Leifsonia sp. NPDC058230 TaxID=3346391 RepID=UPI0036DF0305
MTTSRSGIDGLGAAAEAPTSPIAGGKRLGVLIALCLAVLVVGLDTTVLNVALPTLSRELEASTGQLQWMANSYNLVLAALLLPAGLIGDRFGRKKTLVIALLTFGASSVWCALSVSADELIAARAFLGIGAALLVPVVMSLITVLFPDDAERKKAISFFVVANSIGLPLGPIVGGLLLDHFSWSSIFWISVPVAGIAAIAVASLVPESKSARRPSIDYLGILVSSGALASLVYGITLAGERGWGDPTALILIAVFVVAAPMFVAHERRLARMDKTPLVQLELFRSPAFVWGTVLITVAVFSMFGLLFVMPQYFQIIGGADALNTGLQLLPFIGGMLVGAKLASPLDSRLGPKYTAAVGFFIMAVGVGAGALTGTSTPYGFVAAWFAVAGAGAGFAMPSAMNAALGELPLDRAGAGSSLIQAMRQVGGTVGIAVLGTVLNAVYRARVDTTGLSTAAADTASKGAANGVVVAGQLNSPDLLDSVTAAFTGSLDVMLLVCTGVAVAGVMLSLAFLPGKKASEAN